MEVSTREIKKVPTLRGKTVINFFFEASTRTRTSFEIAAKRLSADAVNISASTSSVVKGETLIDTARNLEAMNPDIIVIRHSAAGAPHMLAQPDPAIRDQRRRRGARAPDAGPARYAHDAGRKKGPSRASRFRSSETYPTAGWRGQISTGSERWGPK